MTANKDERLSPRYFNLRFQSNMTRYLVVSSRRLVRIVATGQLLGDHRQSLHEFAR